MPSPVIATMKPCSWFSRISRSLSSGFACARKPSTLASAAMAAAVSGLSPVIITVLIPIERSCSKRSWMPPLRMSLRFTTPRTFGPTATTSGVAPARAISSTTAASSAGTAPPALRTKATTESAAPLR